MKHRLSPMKFLDRLETVRRGEDECWLWPGRQSKGYVRITIDGVRRPAHCAVYEHLRATIPAGKVLDHLCRVRNCVNPNHLEPVTLGVNVLRGIGRTARQKRQTHCKRGHPLSGGNLYRYRGTRICRACHRERQRERDQRDPERARRDRAANWQQYRARHAPIVRPVPRPNHCYKDHELTPDNTFEYRGHRGCRTCRNARVAAWKRERRAQDRAKRVAH